MSLPAIVEALRMAYNLPLIIALPIFVIAYGLGAIVVAKAVEIWRRVLK